MQTRFTRGEYWLLETVVDCAWPLCYLTARNLEEIVNKPGHGLNYGTLVETLELLFINKLIEAQLSTHEREATLLSRSEIEVALRESGPHDGQTCTFYRLTTLGGSQWEAFARPNWDRYVSEDFDAEQGKGSVTCVDKERLERYLGLLNAVEPQVDLSSRDSNEVRPWQATYWKCLPLAHTVTFSYGLKQRDQPAPREWLLEHLAKSGVYASRDSWYRWR